MSKTLVFHHDDSVGEYDQVEVDRLVDTCPVCHYSGTFEEHAALHERDSARVQVVYSCRRDACASFFIATYRRTYAIDEPDFTLVALQPWTPEEPPIAAKVREMSPRYADVLKQAAYAEGLGLDEIAGGGYRKALEVMVKDFILSRVDLTDEQRKSIPKKFLGKCLKPEWIPDDMIRDFAERAAWLGNDEAHYEKEWAGMDMSNLKELLALTEAAVNTHLRRNDYNTDMPRPQR